MSFHLWLGRPGEEVLRQGTARELAEQAANEAGARVQAPECHACGQPVADADWEDHKRRGHGTGDGVLPYGTADSREVFVPAFNRDELERKKQAWRDRHPGMSLTIAGEGARAEGRIAWQKFRVTKDGRPVR